MTLHIYNTLTRKKEEFKPINPEKVGMYVCGPTVYDFAHIGNARPVIVFDVLYRLLKTLYSDVTYVRNITDVDDKINAKSKETGEDIRTITERTAAMFHQDMAALNAGNPDIEPRATEHIAEMIEMIERLIENGNAYAADGHVLFHVPSMPEYGALSGRNMDDMIAGARVEVASYKKDPADFVLWKPSEDDVPGWESPWGRGRPGWHIECSAMSRKYLGDTFDIHGGGHDLIFPHHENEIAQSCCANKTERFANYWMHNGHLMVEGEKMSKSLGNFFTVHDLLEEVPGEALRFYMLSAQYRSPFDFTKEGVAEAKSTLDRFYTALRQSQDVEAADVEAPVEFMAALKDDLNTPLAISILHELLSAVNKDADPDNKGRLIAAANILGILQQNVEEWLKGGSQAASGLDEADIERMIIERRDAKANKDFATADRIRDELDAQGIVLEDGAGGTNWKRK
ncbi:cysteinyl-tRNA synthetase [Candidatus Terasakiella magnetica]|uniref:Cysteine--tRNA ligase n=1 Tax=Candidatus Terasakiella magnetica TaxID=1867952 RepID=A0A1C3RKK6_9PROT|nr:cysteine--tRNA ligase [Candidatus Terasakiella magnetica]SCA57786.1 cysteinyl-tRNA synthetase [Candidatus Terasakiella magnetica]